MAGLPITRALKKFGMVLPINVDIGGISKSFFLLLNLVAIVIV